MSEKWDELGRFQKVCWLIRAMIDLPIAIFWRPLVEKKWAEHPDDIIKVAVIASATVVFLVALFTDGIVQTVAFWTLGAIMLIFMLLGLVFFVWLGCYMIYLHAQELLYERNEKKWNEKHRSCPICRGCVACGDCECEKEAKNDTQTP